MIRVAIVTSTNGSVMNAVLKLSYMKDRLRTVLSDRDCRAVEIARRHGIATEQLITNDPLSFSDYLADFFSRTPHDLIVSFYTRLFRGRVIDQLKGKLVNFHPSILPACPGMDGFGDTIKAGARFIGATVHLVDSGKDTGCPLLQCAFPFNPGLGVAENRHVIFMAQCRMLIQVVKWYEDGRIVFDEEGGSSLVGGQYEISEYAPNLDFPSAIEFVP